MTSLLFTTFAIMGATFLIGFFVAAVIKMIANWADFFDFWQVHREEILTLKREHGRHHPAVWPGIGRNLIAIRYKKLVDVLQETLHHLRPHKRMMA